MDIEFQGERFRRSTGTSDRRLAKEILAIVENRIAHGEDPFKGPPRNERTFDEFIQEYELHVLIYKARTSMDLDRRALCELARFIGGTRTLRSVSEHDAIQFLGYLLNKPLVSKSRTKGPYRTDKKGLAPRTINRMMESIRAAFKWALEGDRKYVDKNVFKQVKPLSVDENVRPIYKNELARLLQAMASDGTRGKEFLRYILFCLNTGCRRSEAINIEWQDVDLSRQTLMFRRTKTHKQRAVPINAELKGILLEMLNDRRARLNRLVLGSKALPTDRVFAYSKNGATSRFKRYADRAGLSKELHLHCTRHTTAYELHGKGTDMKDLKDILGHSRMEMTEIYSHIHPKRLKAAIETLGFMKLLEGHTNQTNIRKEGKIANDDEESKSRGKDVLPSEPHSTG